VPTAAASNKHLDRLLEIIGKERSLREVNQTLHFAANGLHPRTVGAMHITCADESESECADAFEKGFVRYLLPPLKVGRPVPMRLANLGGQYEWGAIRILEAHFATPASKDSFKLILVKVNAHVGVTPERLGVNARRAFGAIRRYGVDSPCCGALDALLGGSTQAFTEGLRELMGSEGLDRESMLRDPERVDPAFRALVAGLVSSRLQARKAVLDIQDYEPQTPTYWMVVPSTTLNLPDRDSEIVAGVYVVDGRNGERRVHYRGLGDDPSAYRIAPGPHGLDVTDEHVPHFRPGRDHRKLILDRVTGRDGLGVAPDPTLERIRADVAENKHRHHHHARALLRIAVPALAQLAPIPTALLLFAEGAVGIRHMFVIDQLARDLADSGDARAILADVHSQIDQLDPDRAEALIELLVKEYAA
jgi:hypothetical protein